MNLPIKEIMEFLKALVDRSGAKAIVSLAAIAVIYQLTALDKIPGMHGNIAVFAIFLTFCVSRYLEYKKKNGGQT